MACRSPACSAARLAAVDVARSTGGEWWRVAAIGGERRRAGALGTKGIIGGVDFAMLNLRC